MKKQIYVTFCIIGCILFLAWAGFRTYHGIQFDRNCDGFLKRAADANTVDLAKQQLQLAVNYCDANGFTVNSGYTSIWYNTPDEEIGFWYKNLEESLIGLSKVPPDASELEKSNQLMKLRETLLDDDSDGTTVTCPEGISIYPYNKGYFGWAIFSFILAAVFGFLAYRESQY